MSVTVPDVVAWRSCTMVAGDELELEFDSNTAHFQQVPCPSFSFEYRSFRGFGIMELYRDMANRIQYGYGEQGQPYVNVSPASGLHIPWGCTCRACSFCPRSASLMPEQWVSHPHKERVVLTQCEHKLADKTTWTSIQHVSTVLTCGITISQRHVPQDPISASGLHALLSVGHKPSTSLGCCIYGGCSILALLLIPAAPATTSTTSLQPANSIPCSMLDHAAARFPNPGNSIRLPHTACKLAGLQITLPSWPLQLCS